MIGTPARRRVDSKVCPPGIRCKRRICNVALLLMAFISPIAIASPMQTVHRFISSLANAPALAQVPLTELQQLDEGLIRPGSLYPAFNNMSVAAMSSLYRYRRQCSGELDGVPAATREFEQAQCNKTVLPDAWFATHSVHPLGGSYAWHYLAGHPESAPALQRFLHVRERPDALAGLGHLSDDNLDAIVSGQHWLLQGQTLWWQYQQVWRSYAPAVWQPLARQAGLALSVPGQRCDLPLGSICANPIPTFDNWWRWLLAAATLVVVLALTYVWWQRRRLQSRQQFILQMLTHELRTPIANLGNIVESFRHDFDALPASAQIGFGRLADGVQRMRQLADASRHYLSIAGANDRLEVPTLVTLSDWLAALTERHEGLQFCLDQDRRLLLPVHCVELCLDNVLSNARHYGKPPIRLRVGWRKGWLRLTVSDAGVLAKYKLSHMRRSSASASGMGVGLAIVRRVMRPLKGKIRLGGPPTTFTLELPCELQD
jgi:signal transduction histidine kinase